jgi:hypothetical protein
MIRFVLRNGARVFLDKSPLLAGMSHKRTRVMLNFGSSRACSRGKAKMKEAGVLLVGDE